MRDAMVKNVLFCIIVTLLYSIFTYSQTNYWEPTKGPYGGNIRHIAVAHSGLMFVATGDNHVFRSTNNGQSWEAIDNGLPKIEITSFTASNTGTVYIGSYNGDGFSSSDSGNHWSPFNISNYYYADIYGLAVKPSLSTLKDTIFAAITSGLFKSFNSGISWSETAGIPGVSCITLMGITQDKMGGIYVAECGGLVIHYSPNGLDNWKNISRINVGYPNSRVSLAVNSRRDIFGSAVPASSSWPYGLYRSLDSGATWTRIMNGLGDERVNDLSTYSDEIIFAITSSGKRFKSTNNGNNWQSITDSASNQIFTSISVDSSGNLWAGTSGGGMFRSSDSGFNWNQSNIGMCNVKTTGIASIVKDLIFAGTDGGGIYTTCDNGETWLSKNHGLNCVFINSISKVLDSVLFACTDNGIFYSSDYGENWYERNTGLTSLNVNCLTSNSNGILFSGTTGGVFRSTDLGLNWVNLNQGLTDTLILSLTSHDSLIIVGTNSGMFLSSDEGDTWVQSQTGLPMNKTIKALEFVENVCYASVADNGVFISKDFGNNWTSHNTGISSLTVYSLYRIDSTIFAGTDSGMFLSSLNRSAWVPFNNNLKDKTVLSISANNSHLFVGTLGNSVWRSPYRINEIKFSQNNITLPYIGGTYNVKVINSGLNTAQWEVDSDQPWVNIISGDSGVGDGIVYLNCEENLNANSRSAFINLFSPDLYPTTISLKLNQLGFPPGIRTKTRINIIAADSSKVNLDIGVDSLASNALDSSLSEIQISEIGTLDAKLMNPRKNEMFYGSGTYVDFRPFTDTSQIDTYRIVIYSNSAPVTLRWPNNLSSKYNSIHMNFWYEDQLINTVDMLNTVSVSEEPFFGPYIGDFQIIAEGPKEFPTYISDKETPPNKFNLEQNYPNPFNGSTRINYQLPAKSHVTLKIFDVLGREVSILVNGVEEPGYKFVNFDAGKLASGMYYYRLQAGSNTETKKLLLLR